MKRIAPIRSEAAYREVLDRAEVLMTQADQSDQSVIDELELLQILTDRWERDRFELPRPTPVEAIRFRMSQRGLTPRALIPMIGSKSRVYEVLSGARPLSIDMIRALHRDLGIPAEVLIGRADSETSRTKAEPKTRIRARLQQENVMRQGETFSASIERAFGTLPQPALLRKTRTDRTNAKTDYTALDGWCAAVLTKASAITLPAVKKRDLERGADIIARLSTRRDGPAQVRNALKKLGIIFVVLEHYPGTYLDGAAMCRPSDGTPIIAMTLRHDRLDNFWFTLLHEYCHVVRHLNGKITLILDDLDISVADDMEHEADQFAQDNLIAPALWAANNSTDLSPIDIRRIAGEAKVHPAVVAGRWQREHEDYRRFAKMLGRGEVREQLLGEA